MTSHLQKPPSEAGDDAIHYQGPLTMQRLFLCLAILFSLGGPAAAAPLDAGAEIAYQLARPMRVSINVYDSQGEIVRSLLAGAPRQAGSHRELWDGRDREGKPVPPSVSLPRSCEMNPHQGER